MVLSQDGAGHAGAVTIVAQHPLALVALAHDADDAGDLMAKSLADALINRDCVRWRPSNGKDWNDELAFSLPLFSSK
jgi:hypothetical protein